MGLNTEALKAKVTKAVNKLPDTVDVRRHTLDARNEPDGEEFVVRLTGQYYKGRNSFIAAILAEAGQTKTKSVERFMTVIGDDSLLVREGDFFTLNGVTYKIVDLGNTLNVYFDFALERV